MIPDSQHWLSLSAYGRRRGVSTKAVSKAVETERLKASVSYNENGQPKINDPELADREWDANTDLTRAPAYVKDRAAARAPVSVTDDDPFADLAEPVAEDETPGSVAQSSEREKYWKAKIAELKFKKEARELCDASEFEKRIADLVSVFKSRMLGLPSRVKQADPTLTFEQLNLIDELIRAALNEPTAP